MTRSILSAPYFHNEEAAYAFVESRLWPDGPICPHCGGYERLGKLKGKSTRVGVYKCYQCLKPFRVTVGTVFEKSHVPLNVWLQAVYLLASSKKGISSNQLARTLNVTLKTGWFISHRLRKAMETNEFDLFGQGGGDVEADETFIGTDPTEAKGLKGHSKMKVLSLIDRNTGRARSSVIEFVNAKAISKVVEANVSKDARLLTDAARHYTKLGEKFAEHGFTNHAAGEYVSKFDPTVHSNTVESFFSVFKRGMRGVYQVCSKAHLHRYLAEFDFRYSNRVALGISDVERADWLLRGAAGKRLTYKALARKIA